MVVRGESGGEGLWVGGECWWGTEDGRGGVG